MLTLLAVSVFWYLQTVAEGGETYFPRALNAQGAAAKSSLPPRLFSFQVFKCAFFSGKEYNAWNGDHEDCYRGIYVKPVKGNAVLFYSMLPDGRCEPDHQMRQWPQVSELSASLPGLMSEAYMGAANPEVRTLRSGALTSGYGIIHTDMPAHILDGSQG